MYQLNDLLYLMQRLRDPKTGCPWDQKQSFDTIVPHTLEEAYEVADAIERGNKHDIKDELGDLLFQVVFYSQLGAEEGSFDFSGVVDNVVRKLLRRHPHVFPEQNLHASFPEGTEFSEEEVKQQWEKIKAEERRLKAELSDEAGDANSSMRSVLEDIPPALPSLNRAEKMQKRAAQVGFDWPDIPPVLDKLEEEIAELKAELKEYEGRDLRESEPHQRLLDEMGDILFCCVNLARFVKVNPDEALRSTNQKFVDRFSYVEAELQQQGKLPQEASLEEMDRLWEQAKQS